MLPSLKFLHPATATISNGQQLFLLPQHHRSVHYFKEKVAPKLEYKPLPRSGEYILDYRRDRQVIEDGYSPKGASFKLRFELMDQNDIEFMTQFVTEHFVKESNVIRYLNIKGEELIEMKAIMVAKWIQAKNSVIIKDGEKIVGNTFGNIHARDEFDQLYHDQLFHEKPEFIVKHDYAEDIKNGPFKSQNVNRVAVLLEEMEWQTGKFFSKDTEKLGVHEMYAIHPNYMRYYLATKAGILIRSIMQRQGCTHEAGYCVATGTWKMALSTGHKTIFSLPYNRYLENGKPVFENLHDGATAANTTLMDYKRDNSNPRNKKSMTDKN